jgi:membrane-associated phospholipid phosphatase
MIVLVGMARVMLGAHWPSDVLAGIALGLALAATADLLASREPGRASASSLSGR